MRDVALILLGTAVGLVASLLATTVAEHLRGRADAVSAAKVIDQELMVHFHILRECLEGHRSPIVALRILPTSAWRENRFPLLRGTGFEIGDAVGYWYGEVESWDGTPSAVEVRAFLTPPDGDLYEAAMAVRALLLLKRWQVTRGAAVRRYRSLRSDGPDWRL